MHAFRKLSIRQKLTMMGILASGTAILLACTAFLTYELFAYRGDMIRSLFTQAEIVGANSAAAILFNDEPAAAETLAALKADPHIVSAGIYTRDNRAFATYGRIDKQRAVALRERFADHADGHWFENDGLILFRKIVFKGETIGTVYIQSDLEEMHARFWQYLAIIFVILLASSLVAFFISSRLQRNITRPLFHLVETAQTVSREKDYTIRAVAESQDEMGVLVRAFNEMLLQIQHRDAALRRSSDEMEQRVLERTAQLQQANMELAQTKERFRSVAQSANDAIISADSAERILTWNKGARMIFGYTEEEAVGKPLTILMPERDREAYRKGLERVRSSGETCGIGSTIELHGLRKDANEFPLEISLAAWEAGGDTFYSGIVRDITERKRAEEALRRAHDELEIRVEERTAEILKKTRDLETLLYVTSHDLREPLRSIENFSRMVHDRYAKLLDDKGQDFPCHLRYKAADGPGTPDMVIGDQASQDNNAHPNQERQYRQPLNGSALDEGFFPTALVFSKGKAGKESR